MRAEWVEGIILVIFLCGFVGGVSILFQTDMKKKVRQAQIKRRLIPRKLSGKSRIWLKAEEALPFIRQLDTPEKRNIFVLLTVFLMVDIFSISVRLLSLSTSMALAFFAACVPWILLWVKNSISRHKGSHEGEAVISSMLSQYRICNYNILETIDAVIGDGNMIPYSSKQLSKLLIEIRQSGGESSLAQATDRFATAMGTNWGKMLATDIRLSAGKGTNITIALEEILKQLRETRTLLEERKRMNSETVRMAFFMLPIVYMITIFMAVRLMNIPFLEILHNQFNTPQGFLMIFSILFAFFINIVLIELVRNQKFDF